MNSKLRVLAEHWKALREATTFEGLMLAHYWILMCRVLEPHSDIEMMVASGALSAYPERWG